MLLLFSAALERIRIALPFYQYCFHVTGAGFVLEKSELRKF
jgi:hypothetical protein